MKRIAFAVAALMVYVSLPGLAADEKAPVPVPVPGGPAAVAKAEAKKAAVPGGPALPPGVGAMSQRPFARPAFGMVFGSVTKIDTKDPAKPVLEVKSDADNKTHTFELAPKMNVMKATDLSELKVGDTVRVMTTKVDEKEVAMGVMFGKIKNIPARGARTPGQKAQGLTLPPLPKPSAPARENAGKK